ncbi:MAG: AAA family ATPase [Leptolyngbya sp. SIOISBB]|nr:AAA family ATPase [Leptolyngbya sp. SIOISBB]
MAQLPTAVDQVNPAVPAPVAAIVAKLMAKNAEDRYQSALGLKTDLERCLTEWEKQGHISDFALGERDLSDRFLIPEKLYGREPEVQALLDVFERVAQGHRELMLVAGFSGIGKTAVINEVHKPIVKNRGYFIKGKFDQFNRNIPFSAFVQAFRHLMGQILSESNTALDQWETQILAAVGPNGQVLIDVIPELERVIGEQPAVPELSGSAAQNRFNLLFEQFIAVFTTPEHPLVIFLDDLQWADSASLNLMKVLMGDRERGYLLLLGAYRDNEVFPTHPLMLSLADLAKQKATISTITLAPLSIPHINQLVAETLSCPVETAQPLTELVYQKTQGNPFFSTQFLTGLHEDELITFNPSLGDWECDLVKVLDAALTDDVVEFMAGRLQKLPAGTQAVLKLAACIGNQFDLKTLAIVREKPWEEVASELWIALQEGIISPISEAYKFFQDELSSTEADPTAVNYRFLHDRIQQAAYSLIPEEQKKANHYYIGQLLLKGNSQAQEENIFDIVNNLNKGISIIDDYQQHQELVSLNLIAGQKAKQSAAYSESASYFEQAIELLGEKGWRDQYTIILEVYSELIDVQFLRGEFQVVDAIYTQTLEQLKTHVDAIAIYRAQISSYHAQGKIIEALELGIDLLNSLDLEICIETGAAAIERKFKQTLLDFSTKSIRDFVELHQSKEQWLLGVQDLLSLMIGCAYKARPELLSPIICEQVSLLMRYGNIPASASIYANYGFLLCNTKEFEWGYFAGEVALAVMESLPAKQFEARAINIIYTYLKPWKNHLRDSLSHLKKNVSIGLESGDLEYAAYSINNYCKFIYHAGINLETVNQEMKIYCDVLKAYRQEPMLIWTQIFHQTVANLMGNNDFPWEIEGDSFKESEHLLYWQENNIRHFSAPLYINKLVLSFIFNKTTLAVDYAAIASQDIDGFREYQLPFLYAYRALSHLALVEQYSLKAKQECLKQVVTDIEKLEGFASKAPMNFQHYVDLIKAEKCRVLGEKNEAIELYDHAIARAKENAYIQEEALANELAAKFYLNWGREKVAAVYMQDAYYCYTHWGAKAKVADLETRYPELLRPILAAPATSNDVLTTLVTLAAPTISVHPETCSQISTNSLNQTLDFASVLKASQAISSTIQLDDLLSQFIQIMLTNSGSDRCALLLPDEAGIWQVRAMATPQETHLGTEPLDNNPHVPVKLIQYVKNTQEALVIDDLETDMPVVDDYLRHHQPSSVLCLPILNQGRCIGVLYLSNQLTSGVFTNERILVLNFLCIQASISLENARLYTKTQEDQRRLATLMSNLPGMAYLAGNDRHWTMYFASEGCFELTGYTSDELTNNRVTDFGSIIHPDDIEATCLEIEAAIAAQRPYQVVYRIRTKQGEEKWLWEQGQAMWDDNGHPTWLEGLIIDISDRKAAEEASQQFQKRLEFLIDQAPMGMVEWNPDFEIIGWNTAAEKIFGYSATEMLGQQGMQFIPESVRPWVAELRTKLREQRGGTFSLNENLRKDGTTIICEWVNTVLRDADKNFIGVFSMVQDVSERESAKAAITQKSQTLKQTLAKLQQTQLQMIQSEKMAVLGNLVAGVAHEVNNPIGFLNGSIQNAEDYVQDLFEYLETYQELQPPNDQVQESAEEVDLDFLREDLPKLLNSMKGATDRIKGISTSLRTFSRADTENKVTANLHEGLDSTLLILKYRLKANQQRPAIEVEQHYGELPEIECFPGQLNQVFMNILANAIDMFDEAAQKNTFEEMRKNPQKITIKTAILIEKNVVKIRIADNGEGMSDEIKSKIFNSSFTTKEVGKGTGLGLAIAQQIIEETHEGTLTVESKVGQGTEFCIYLPAS